MGRQRPADKDGAQRSTADGQKLSAKTTPARLTSAAPRAEASAWLRGAVARRRRQIEALRLDLDAVTTVVAPLGRPGAPGDDDDRSCDRCGHVTPIGEAFTPFVVRPTEGLALVGGLCGVCADREAAR